MGVGGRRSPPLSCGQDARHPENAGGDRRRPLDERCRYTMRRASARRFLIPFSSPSARVTKNSRPSKSSRVPASASATMSSAKSPRHAANVTDAMLPTRKKMASRLTFRPTGESCRPRAGGPFGFRASPRLRVRVRTRPRRCASPRRRPSASPAPAWGSPGLGSSSCSCVFPFRGFCHGAHDAVMTTEWQHKKGS